MMDIVALVAIVGCIILIAMGKDHDGTVIAAFLSVVGYYFGTTAERARVRRNHRKAGDE